MSCFFGWNGIDRSTLGILGAGQRIAQELASEHIVLIVGAPSQDVIDELAQFTDKVQIIEHALLTDYQFETTLTALTEACRSLQPNVVLFGNETYCQEIVPRLAHRLKGSAAGDAQSLALRDDDSILVTRSVYGGKAQATLALRRKPAIVWIRARAFGQAQAIHPRLSQSVQPGAEIVRMPLVLELDARVKLVDRQKELQETARLEDARIIVSGGRGLGGPEPFTELQSLATVVGGQVAASRAACDAGWVPAGLQVGQTGKKVAPQLYLAIAISGASQHIMGIADAKTIAAINLDPDAPIFHHCRFGLVDDYRKVLGPLRDKLIELLA